MIQINNLKVGYDDKIIIEDLSLEIKKGEVVSIIGPNGSGKSTLLKTMAKFLKKTSGQISILDKNIDFIKENEMAKILAMLSQQNASIEDITVRELVYYGRIPHKKWYDKRNKEDEEIIEWALKHTGMYHYRDRNLFNLSGGEKQRVWLAMALAQKTEVLFLDEPTTYLDMCYQLELMELVKEINKKFNMTIVMVLHDLNQAARYSDRIVIMKSGNIIANGSPEEVITSEIIEDVYNVRCCIKKDLYEEKPYIYPLEVCCKSKERCKDCEI